MKRNILSLFIGAVCFLNIWAVSQPVIPQPAEFSIAEGTFSIPSQWTVSSTMPVAVTQTLMDNLKQPFVISDKNADLFLENNHEIGEEGYTLSVNAKGVTIEASSEKGFFYGLQTLFQLSREKGKLLTSLPLCEINDYPRFGYRALMLDVTRHFIPKEEVLRIIDIAAGLKLNNLHMHLTDDNGWRLEIKKFPKLTDVGAWRVDRKEYFPGRSNQTDPQEPTPVGGFYTQDDMREIVKYAADRYINVIPEIEMPAHAAAAIASYPELACPVVEKFVGVFPGIGGKDASIIICAGNKNVYDFYTGVLDEVMDIFPSQYIHLGGDEADKIYWRECPLCNEMIVEENLEGYEGLQAYFMDRINSYVRSKGRTAIGWDEVTYGNPKEDMIIMGWQGNGNIAVEDARKNGRKFIMTPALTLYLIRYQGPQWFEPVTYFGNNTLENVYLYEPVKEDWSPELKDQLLGIQGSLWTEFCNNSEDVEYLLFPRLIALADNAWRPENSANYEGFLYALDDYLAELDTMDVNYAQSMFNIQHTVKPRDNGVEVTLISQRPDLEIKYSVNNPDGTQILYENPIVLTQPTVIYANTYKDNEPMGKRLELVLNFNKATGKKVFSENSRNSIPYILTNGVRGSDKHTDFEWVGWFGNDAEFTIDLGEEQKISGVKLGTIANSDFLVAMPSDVSIYGSLDGQNFELISTVETPEGLVYARKPLHYDINFGDLNAKARYLKFIAKNPGNIPEGLPRWGTPSWIYFDEVMIE